MTSYSNSSQEAGNAVLPSSENKRNRKTQMLTALLSATALGVFLEGCGGGDTPASATTTPDPDPDPNPNPNPNPNPTPTPAASGSEGAPFLATAAAETFIGESGKDWVSYEESDVGVRLDLLLATGTAQADFATNNFGFGVDQGGDAVGDTLTDIKNLVGSIHNDWLTGDGEDNNLQGGGGNDRLDGGGGDDTLDGGDGDDILNGGDGDDILNGGDGNDGISGGAGADTLQGGAGDDPNLDGGADNDIIEGGAGVDTLSGFTGDDSLDGGAGNDYLFGGDGEDSYIFESGHGADNIAGDEDGGNLLFRAATRFEDFIFERTFGGVKIRVGEDSVEILWDSYGNGNYNLYQGSGDEILGGLIVLGYTGSHEARCDYWHGASKYLQGRRWQRHPLRRRGRGHLYLQRWRRYRYHLRSG